MSGRRRKWVKRGVVELYVVGEVEEGRRRESVRRLRGVVSLSLEEKGS